VLTHDAFLPWTLGLGLFLGLWGIFWTRLSPTPRGARWGRRLFVINFLVLGVATYLAALYRLDGLAPLGLLSGLLVVGMVWDAPRPAKRTAQKPRVASALPEIVQPPAFAQLAPDGSRVA
jgi:hypothetical protein